MVRTVFAFNALCRSGWLSLICKVFRYRLHGLASKWLLLNVVFVVKVLAGTGPVLFLEHECLVMNPGLVRDRNSGYTAPMSSCFVLFSFSFRFVTDLG